MYWVIKSGFCWFFFLEFCIYLLVLNTKSFRSNFTSSAFFRITCCTPYCTITRKTSWLFINMVFWILCFFIKTSFLDMLFISLPRFLSIIFCRKHHQCLSLGWGRLFFCRLHKYYHNFLFLLFLDYVAYLWQTNWLLLMQLFLCILY